MLRVYLATPYNPLRSIDFDDTDEHLYLSRREIDADIVTRLLLECLHPQPVKHEAEQHRLAALGREAEVANVKHVEGFFDRSRPGPGRFAEQRQGTIRRSGIQWES